MMIEHHLKFAVVREDPAIELAIIERRGDMHRCLVVASGGCTALSLAAQFESLAVTAYDVNPQQLDHLQHKATAAQNGDLAALGVESTSAWNLNQCGAFEGLFRQLKAHIETFVAPREEIEGFFAPDTHPSIRARWLNRWVSSRYWAPGFDAAFGDSLLHAMFGPAATQHADPGSYPAYFASAFERGLASVTAHRNPFLQHVLLGKYLVSDAPRYACSPNTSAVQLELAPFDAISNLEQFDLVTLSNILDWADDSVAEHYGRVASRGMRPGSIILLRQLNNQRNVARFFEPWFSFDTQFGADLLSMDRSLFYNHILVGRRTEAVCA